MGRNTKINDLIDVALQRNKRRNPEVEDIIKGQVCDWMKDLFTAYPFWFLKVLPGYTFAQNNLPLTQTDLDTATPVSIVNYPTITHWLDRGILRTEAGKSHYELFAPAETGIGDVDGDNWRPAKSQKALSSVLYSLEGQVRHKLKMPTSMVANMELRQPESSPYIAYIESQREFDVIRLVPTPDKAYMMHVSWVLAEPLKYYLDPLDSIADNWTTKFIQEYSECAQYLVMLKASEYFNDLKKTVYYKEELYGKDGSLRVPTGGKIANIKREHLRKAREESYSIPMYRGNPAPFKDNLVDPWGRRGGKPRSYY